jgi:cytochrome c oxidase subunit 2
LPPPAIVDNAHEYHRVFDVYVPIAIGVFALFTLLIVGFAIRGRFRPPTATSKKHKNDPLEMGYAVLLTCVAAFLLYMTFSSEHRIDTVSLHEKPFVTIDVTGSQWEWTFYYPAYRITRRSGAVGRQPLVVPTGVPVRLNIFSRDVIHSLWFPSIDFKRDAFPGARNVVVLDFAHPGDSIGHCAEFCGVRHADMVFPLHAVSPSRFTAWARSGGASAA